MAGVDLEDCFKLGQELGRGSFGVVRSCRPLNSLFIQDFACKSIKMEFIKSVSNRKSVQTELKVLRMVKGHPYLVKLEYAHQDSTGVHVIMEKCEGDLFDELKSRGKFPESEARDIFAQLVIAVSFLHEKGVVHRDLKLENVLVSHEGSSPREAGFVHDPVDSHFYPEHYDFDSKSSAPSSVVDFDTNSSLDGSVLSGELNYDFSLVHDKGLAGPLDSPTSGSKVKLADFGLCLINGESQNLEVAGSPLYLAPELLKVIIASKSRVRPSAPIDLLAVDVWSLGIILFSILTGKFPFSGSNALQLYMAIKVSDLDVQDKAFAGLSPDAKDLVKLLLNSDPAHRPPAPEIMNHPWMLSAREQFSSAVESMVPTLETDETRFKFYGKDGKQLDGFSIDEIIEDIQKLENENCSVINLGQPTKDLGNYSDFLSSPCPDTKDSLIAGKKARQAKKGKLGSSLLLSLLKKKQPNQI